jgi:hypothetical protein
VVVRRAVTPTAADWSQALLRLTGRAARRLAPPAPADTSTDEVSVHPLPDPTPEPDDPPLALPWRRRLTDPAERHHRTPTMSIRRTSGLPLAVRIERQVERDALLHRLDRIDARLLELSEERSAIVAELGKLRDELYPVVPWCHGRRPPDPDRGPLPPAAAGARAIAGRHLRATCLAILRRHGPTSLRELHSLLHRYGYVVRSTHPVTCLSDAMAYEVEQHRARRVERGTYEAVGEAPRRRRDRPAPYPEPPPHPEPWHPQGPSALDPTIEEDPLRWRSPPEQVRPHPPP